jgi:HSP20 family protein
MNGILRNKSVSAKKHELNPLTRLHDEIDHAMHDFYNLFESTTKSTLGVFENIKLSPALDIIEDKDSFKLEVEMPGLGEEDIRLSVNENILTIEAEKSTSKKDDKKNFLSREISYGRYERTISLPLSADLDKASASFKKGLLWITIPKKSASKGGIRKIAVQKAK